MKKRNIIILVLIVLGFLVLGTGYYMVNKSDQKTTLTIVEKKWIESNKNKVIDLSVINEIPVLNYNGKGLFFDFLTDLEKTTGLEFNKVSLAKGEEPTTQYSFMATSSVKENDLVLYQDNYALVMKKETSYNHPAEIRKITIGVLKDDLERIDLYLNGADVTFKSFDSVGDMLIELTKENQTAEDGTVTVSSIDAVVLPKTTYLKEIINHKLFISYQITEMHQNYVLRLGDTDRLNTILKKYYQKWKDENYQTSYYTNLATDYFEFKNIEDKEKTSFRSKRYIYGFVNNAPYDILIGGRLYGFNRSFLASFSKLADVEISFKEYSSISDLLKDFNQNKLDIVFNNYEDVKYDMDVKSTGSPYLEQIVVVSPYSCNITVNSLNSLQYFTVSTVRSSRIASLLKNNNIKIKEYDSVHDLLQKKEKDAVLVLDYDVYGYYKNDVLKDYKIDYQTVLDSNYSFVVRDIKDNAVLYDLLTFYLAFDDSKRVINDGYNTLLKDRKMSAIVNPTTIVLSGGLLIVLLGLLIYFKVIRKRRKAKNAITKEHKLRYIDSLTSLKNRTYLNANIEKWDASEVYPQAIIIIDLNNIAYINDNYGHAEGDKVIKEAANILIRTQIENTDIIRTNGNEFLIYLVGYDEKQVVTYNRKLNKELKELSHGFGAASGYSMIMDAIKTVDDAVNEATLDMRNNKEELNN